MKSKRKVNFRLMVITDRKLASGNLLKVVNECCRYGVKVIQLREKNLHAAQLMSLSKKLRSITGKTRTKLIINDRLDIAQLSNASGLHLPEKGAAKRYLAKYKNLILGKSVHSAVQARKAEKDGYDYILFGPIFRTPAKVKYGSPHGLKKLKDVCSSVNIPVFAVGGITPQRVKKCMDAGAYGIAVIGPVMKSINIRKTINEFRSELGSL